MIRGKRGGAPATREAESLRSRSSDKRSPAGEWGWDLVDTRGRESTLEAERQAKSGRRAGVGPREQ
jgi:hypothetical protein